MGTQTNPDELTRVTQRAVRLLPRRSGAVRSL
jgi:hypothetical protein